jgi:1-acyl-sn-glycerol-3-phosphate acyltransferase
VTPLRRRFITIPLYLTLLLVALATLPVTLVIAATIDVIRRTPWGFSRSILFFTWYLLCEVLGVIISFFPWLLYRLGFRVARERYVSWHYRLECWWARMLLAGATKIFGMHFEIEGDDDLGPGPVLLFMRHASVSDTVLPAVFLSHRRGLRLRYVMKQELLWDPCLDIVGNRVPNYFVRRGTGDGSREIEEIGRLAEDMGPGEGVLIYPEGTRFTEEKRSKILDHLARAADRSLEARARALHHTLPPKLGGPLKLLDCRPDADVLFLAHLGFEKASRFSEFLRGGLVGTEVRISVWRIPAGEVPSGREARIDWLFDQWQRVDSWIAENQVAAVATSEQSREAWEGAQPSGPEPDLLCAASAADQEAHASASQKP